MTQDYLKCSATHCISRAVVAPKLNVPAAGFAPGSHEPLTAIIGIPVCPPCMDEMTAADLLNDPMKDLFAAWARTHKKAPPNFEDAFLTMVLLDSKEYAQWQASRGKKR